MRSGELSRSLPLEKRPFEEPSCGEVLWRMRATHSANHRRPEAELARGFPFVEVPPLRPSSRGMRASCSTPPSYAVPREASSPLRIAVGYQLDPHCCLGSCLRTQHSEGVVEEALRASLACTSLLGPRPEPRKWRRQARPREAKLWEARLATPVSLHPRSAGTLLPRMAAMLSAQAVRHEVSNAAEPSLLGSEEVVSRTEYASTGQLDEGETAEGNRREQPSQPAALRQIRPRDLLSRGSDSREGFVSPLPAAEGRGDTGKRARGSRAQSNGLRLTRLLETRRAELIRSLGSAPELSCSQWSQSGAKHETLLLMLQVAAIDEWMRAKIAVELGESEPQPSRTSTPDPFASHRMSKSAGHCHVEEDTMPVGLPGVNGRTQSRPKKPPSRTGRRI
ncbi:MAG: hypothetical protein SGPRY_012233 [Prymnesium sp.]